MSRVCEISGAKRNNKNIVSHANNKTHSIQQPNLQMRTVWVPELGRDLKLRITTRALRTLKKQANVLQFLKDSGVKI